jgi:hypothetical protein
LCICIGLDRRCTCTVTVTSRTAIAWVQLLTDGILS